MNLDDLKTTWKTLDERLLATHTLSEHVALSMMKDRSKGTLARMRRELQRISVFFAALLVLFGAIIAGNPFDYTHRLHYLPAIVYTLLVVVALGIQAHEYILLGKVSLTKSTLRESLQTVIQSRQRFLATMGTVWKLSLGAGFLLGISLVARHFEAYGFTKSLLVVGGQALTVLLVYALAKWVLARSPDSHLTELEAHLQELQELERT